MPPKPGPSPVGEPGKADPETPAGDEDKDAKAAKAKLKERAINQGFTEKRFDAEVDKVGGLFTMDAA